MSGNESPRADASAWKPANHGDTAASPATVPAGPASRLERSVQAELAGFASRMLEKCGGLVEWAIPGEAGTVVLPNEVATLFGVEETVALAPRQERGTLCIGLASEFLDQAEVALKSLVPRLGTFRIPDRYLKGGDRPSRLAGLQTAVDRQFTWHNARVRVGDAAPQSVDYHAWWFFASLKSEDTWESRLCVTINAASQAPVDLPDFLSLVELEPCLDPSTVKPDDTFSTAALAIETQVLDEAAGFITRMESRLDRDRKRLRDYYGALQRETGSTRRRNATAPSAQEIDARRRAVNLELQRKLAELAERYEMQGSLEPITLVCLQATVLAVELLVQRKRSERTHRVYWNPLTKQFEPMCCQACGRGTFSVAFTNDDVAPLCAGCHSTSPSATRRGTSLRKLPG